MMSDLRVALVSREVYPFEGGGISYYVNSTARALADVAEVTIVTTGAHEAEHSRLSAAGDQRLPPGVNFEFVPPPHPDESGSYYGFFHHYSARVLETLARAYPDGGPDLVEFGDYHGEGAVTVQARHTLDPRLRNTTVCVHTHTSSEMCQVLDGRMNPDFRYRAMFELERYSLRYADHVIWPGATCSRPTTATTGNPASRHPCRSATLFSVPTMTLPPAAPTIERMGRFGSSTWAGWSGERASTTWCARWSSSSATTGR